MTSQPLAITAKSYARIAGVLYLVIAAFGAFAIGYVPSVIMVAGDAAATARNLADNMNLFRMGMFSDIVVLLTEVVLTAMLYVMFRPVSPTLSLVAGWSRLAMVLVMGVNLLINVMPMVLLGGAPFASGMEPAALQVATMGLFEAHQMGVYVWQMFFAMHLVALGWMMAHSKLFPRVLGWMMVVGAFGYGLQGLVHLTGTESPILTVAYVGLLVLVTVGELAFALWLLVRGVRASG